MVEEWGAGRRESLTGKAASQDRPGGRKRPRPHARGGLGTVSFQLVKQGDPRVGAADLTANSLIQPLVGAADAESEKKGGVS